MKNQITKIVWALVGILVLYTFYFLWQQSQPEAKVYEILTPATRTLEKKTVANGKVEPRDEVNLKPQIQGIVTELYHEAGDIVAAGEPIAKIQVIPEMAQLSNAQSNLHTAKLTLEETEKEYSRSETLHQKGVISKEEYDQAKNNLDKARENVQSAQDALDIVTSGISKRSGKINTTLVTSTISGKILDIPVKVGTTVVNASNYSDGTTVATVADMGDIIFRGNVDETEVDRLKNNMDLTLTIGAIQGVKLPATLEYISPKGTESNGAIMFEIKAAASNVPDSVTIRAGYSANAEIIVDRKENAFSVEEAAIEFDGDSTYVYVLKTDPSSLPQKYEKVPVTLGLSDGLYVEILSGVTSDMRLRGNEKDKDEEDDED